MNFFMGSFVVGNEPVDANSGYRLLCIGEVSTIKGMNTLFSDFDSDAVNVTHIPALLARQNKKSAQPVRVALDRAVTRSYLVIVHAFGFRVLFEPFEGTVEVQSSSVPPVHFHQRPFDSCAFGELRRSFRQSRTLVLSHQEH